MRFVANVLLARILPIDFFGLMQIVNALNRGLVMLSDTGIRTYLIQSDDEQNDLLLNTAWTIQVVRGFIIFLIMLVLAYPISIFYGDTRMAFLLPMVGVVSVITGFMSISFLTIQKQMHLGRVTVCETGAQIASLVGMVVWALISPSVWVLAGGGAINAVTRLVLSYLLFPSHKHRFCMDKPSARAMFRFGKWIMVATALTFLAVQADRLILGKLATLEQVAVYGLALSFVQMFRDLVQKLSGRVLLPAISEKKNLPREELRAKIDRIRRPMLLLACLPIAFIAVFGDVIVDVIYPIRWQEAGGLLMILAVGFWPLILTLTIGSGLVALGYPQYNTVATAVRLVLLAIGIPYGFLQYGLVGAAVAGAAADVPIYIVMAVGRSRHKLGGFTTDLLTTAAFAAVVMALWLLRGL